MNCIATPSRLVDGDYRYQGFDKSDRRGRYKDVNTIGVASIVAIKNAMKNELFPFVFGGDGATALIPASKRVCENWCIKTYLEGAVLFGFARGHGLIFRHTMPWWRSPNICCRAKPDCVVSRWRTDKRTSSREIKSSTKSNQAIRWRPICARCHVVGSRFIQKMARLYPCWSVHKAKIINKPTHPMIYFWRG